MQKIFSRRKLAATCLLSLTWILGAGAGEVQAHARLLKASPADKSEVAKAPERIELWFSELLDDGFNAIEVFAAKDLPAKHRPNLIKGAPQVDAKDRTRLIVPLESLGPGEYVVEWRVLSRDGHSAPGRFRFRIAAPK